MQLLQLGSWLDTDLLDQQRPCAPIRLERLGLSTGAVEREHTLSVQALAQRVLVDQRVQLGNHVAMAAGRKVALDR